MPYREIALPVLNPAASSLKAFNEQWRTMFLPMSSNSAVVTCASGWTRAEESSPHESRFILIVEWSSPSAFHHMLFSAPEFQAFASKIMPFVLAPAKALLFVTEAFRPRVVNQTVVPVRTIEVFLTHNTGMDRDPSRNGEEGADRLTRSGIGNVWASFVASITKEVTLFKDVLDIEYGPSLPYGPTGVGEQAEVQDRAAEGPFIGIITWASKEERSQRVGESSQERRLVQALKAIGRTEKMVADVNELK